MTDHPRIKRLGLVLILGLIWLFVTGSLVGRDPADPPGFDVAPVNVAPQNPCGYLGALLAYELVSTLGGSSPLVPLALGFVVYLMTSGNWNSRRGVRALAGFVLLVVVASTALDRWNPSFGAHPLAGPGGYLGASIRRALEWELGAVGVQVFLFSSLFIAFIFIFEQVPFHFLLNNRLFHRPGRVSAAPPAALDLVRPAEAGAAAAAVIAAGIAAGLTLTAGGHAARVAGGPTPSTSPSTAPASSGSGGASATGSSGTTASPSTTARSGGNSGAGTAPATTNGASTTTGSASTTTSSTTTSTTTGPPAAGAPVLASVTPAAAKAGQTVTLTGRNLYSSNGRITVVVGSSAAGVTCPSETRCVVTLPALHTHGRVPLRMTTSGGRSNTVMVTYH